MNTLQLYISKSSQDNKRLAEINPTDDGRAAASDMRSAVALIDYAPSVKTVFFIVANTQNGYAIHIIRTIPPTRPNHLDATVFIDKDLDIMAEDLEEVLAKVSDIVLAKAVTADDMDQLKELFAREYDLRDHSPRIKASRGRDYACLTYGGKSMPSLSDIIADGLYRAEWSNFKAVVLLNDSISPLPNSMVMLDASDEAAEELIAPREENDERINREDSEIKSSRNENRRPTHSYIFGLPVVTPDGSSIMEFELECLRPISKSPIEGYTIVGKAAEGPDRINKLRRSNRGDNLFSRLERWIWGAGGLVIGMLIIWIVGLFSDSPSDSGRNYIAEPSVTTAQQTNPQPNAPASSQAVHEATEATAYLDSNRTWRRDDMEKIKELQGLFDDLNNFRFENINGHWAETLAASKNFANVVKASRKSVSKKIDPRRDSEHNPTYNREGDTSISWLGYTFWIDP